MGLYKVETLKGAVGIGGGHTWRNVYHLNAASIGDANGLADTIVAAEMAMSSNAITLVSKRTSDVARLEPTINDLYSGTSGDQAYGSPQIPPWNVVVVNFRDASGGRSERKYYRLGFTEAQIDGGSVDATVLTTLQAVIETLVSDLIAMCSPSGDTIVEGTVLPVLGMRQLGWHRRKRPGFHRGYVPD